MFLQPLVLTLSWCSEALSARGVARRGRWGVRATQRAWLSISDIRLRFTSAGLLAPLSP